MADEQKPFHTEDGKQFSSAITGFALQLFKEQSKRCSKNIFLSPLSISAVLSMTYLGARGNTLTEMRKALLLDDLDDSKLHLLFSDIITHLTKCSGDVNKFSNEPKFQVFMANRLYGQKSYNFLEEFQTACANHYKSDLSAVDFVNEPEKTVELINSWVLECTNQKIKDIISRDSIDSNTRLILVNAIYFKSAWKDPFHESQTADSKFHVSADDTVPMKLMFQKIEKARYCHSKDLLCQVLKLPYQLGALSMFILLPDKSSSSLEEMEKKLTASHLINIDDGLQMAEVNLWLPKFKVEERLDLKDILRDLGMKDLFDISKADLSGIDGTKTLYAAEVVHKAFVDVNEKGTEAAAATFLRANTRSMRLPQIPVDFRADHPFLYFIREEESKAILFLGRLVKPNYE